MGALTFKVRVRSCKPVRAAILFSIEAMPLVLRSSTVSDGPRPPGLSGSAPARP